MSITKSTFTLLASLMIVLLFVVMINLTTGENASAGNLATLQEEGRSNPIREKSEVEEEFEEEEGENREEFEEEFEDEEEGIEHRELERLEVETNIGRLEMISRLAEIANNDTATASYAIMHMEDFIDDEEEAIELLESLISSKEVTKPVKNLLKMKLAEVYTWTDRHEDAKRVLESMLKSK